MPNFHGKIPLAMLIHSAAREGGAARALIPIRRHCQHGQFGLRINWPVPAYCGFAFVPQLDFHLVDFPPMFGDDEERG